MRARVVLTRSIVASTLLAAGAGAASGSVVLGQIDTFTSGTSAFWTGGSGPSVVEEGGPGGITDAYLQQNSDGVGSGGKLSMYNREQWLGDYVSAGVTAIAMDLKNLSTQTLSMRIAFKTGSGPSAPGYVSTTPVTLPTDGQWHHAVFMLDPARFTAIGGPVAFDSVIGGLAQEFRILHSTTPLLTGTNITASVGVDNIAAIPAPSGGAVLLSAVSLVGLRRRRAR